MSPRKIKQIEFICQRVIDAGVGSCSNPEFFESILEMCQEIRRLSKPPIVISARAATFKIKTTLMAHRP